ncbi:MAG: sodium-dependent transporter [Eubacteriales bacterium]|nr:sodium-dependent transporter [Eubacteriales bacterium]
MNDKWNSKLGFLMAAIGSAVGLGNLWRFPYVAASNGGGAFLLPYFFAIITAGIPILIMEYTIGKTYRGGAPAALARINQKFEWLGWVQVMVSFMILIYYFAIVVWTLCYVFFSIKQTWGADPTSFFVSFLGTTDSAHHLGGIKTNLILPFLIVWGLAAVIMYAGISKGIERACRIGLPILLILTFVLVIRGITLPGATEGLQYMFKPRWSSLHEPHVWVAAYGQIFYSLSIAFGIMVSYASYLPKKTDVVNAAFITACANHGFEIFAGIGVFSIIGFMASQQGVPIEQVAGQGVGLAFMTFPTAISTLPAMNGLVGVCFFGALFVAGITSLISISQVIITGIEGKFKISSHKRAVTLVFVPSFLLSILFITGAGLNILDILDAHINNVGLTVCGFVEVLMISWLSNPEKIRTLANEYSNFSVGKWWTYSLKIITVIMLGVMTFLNTYQYITKGYGSYSRLDQTIFGWGALLIVAVFAVIFTRAKGFPGYNSIDSIPVVDDDEEVA